MLNQVTGDDDMIAQITDAGEVIRPAEHVQGSRLWLE